MSGNKTTVLKSFVFIASSSPIFIRFWFLFIKITDEIAYTFTQAQQMKLE